ncbi:MAG: FAD/NAD(P)-binding protein [Polyangiales bacterium]
MSQQKSSEAKTIGTSTPVAWVFGAGITGLSAAHELVERGFEVYVVEPAADPMEPELPAVGGVAKTQWAFLSGRKGVEREGQATGMRRALPYLRHPVFETTLEAPKVLTMGDGEFEELERFAKLVARSYGADAPTFGLRGVIKRGGEVSNEELDQALDLVRDRARKAGLSMSGPAEDDKEFVDAAVGIRVEILLRGAGLVPGEHGFRYFPGFYRHLFDTMRRTLLTSRSGDVSGPVARSVFENLVGTEATWLVVPKPPGGLETDSWLGTRRQQAVATPPAPQAATPSPGDAAGAPQGLPAVKAGDEPAGPEFRLVKFPRHQTRSPREMLSAVEAFVKELGYTGQDLARLSLKLFQYMSSSIERRAAEFEDLTWWDFIEGDKFTERCRDHMEKGPEVLGAMTASESDARTQGNMVTQLLLDQLTPRQLTDATLNGPTSPAWFDFWRDYLVYRGVRFFRGALEGFDPPDKENDAHDQEVLLPRVRVDGDLLSRRNFTTARRTHYFVLALPVTSLLGLKQFVDEDGHCGLAQDFLAAHANLAIKPGEDNADALRVDDFEALTRFEAAITAEQTDPSLGAGPLRHLTGVQYFFPANLQFGQEHTLYMSSEWRLSSISQAHFWNRRPTGVHGYRGVVSVDIGALHRASDEAVTTLPSKTAWQCSAPEIAERVWKEVAATIGRDTQRGRKVAPPSLLSDSEAEDPPYAQRSRSPSAQTGSKATGNRERVSKRAPARASASSTSIDLEASDGERAKPVCFHIDQNLVFGASGVARNLAPYLINRPREWKLRPGALREGDDRHRGYNLQNRSWVLAGTYMKTFTRLTTMEAANESARHAVNAILEDLRAPGDRCMIWDPEEWELPDLDFLKEIDRRLFVDGYPHMVEILGLTELPLSLLNTLKGG